MALRNGGRKPDELERLELMVKREYDLRHQDQDKILERLGKLESQLNYWTSADGARELTARHGYMANYRDLLERINRMAGPALKPAWNPAVGDAVGNNRGDYGWLRALPDDYGLAVVTVTKVLDPTSMAVPMHVLAPLVLDPSDHTSPGWRFDWMVHRPETPDMKQR